MASREEIREGIAIDVVKYMMTKGYMIKLPLDLADTIMKRESSQGVVRKVDRELPELLQKQGPHKEFAERDLKRRLDKAGYVAVKPLIEE